MDLRLPGSLSNCIRVQPNAFDPKTYQVESNLNYKDEKGIMLVKTCPVTNFIRWRYTEKKDTKAVDDIEKIKLIKQVGLNFKETAPKVSLQL